MAIYIRGIGGSAAASGSRHPAARPLSLRQAARAHDPLAERDL
jgi:hypothetical protein